MNTFKIGALLAALMFVFQPVRAERIWQMGVTNYTDGATNLLSAVLADDMFTSLSATTVYLRANETAPGEFNLAVSNGTAQAKNVRLQAGLMIDHKLIVASFDYVSATEGGVNANALSSANARPHNALAVLSGSNAPARFTMVVNRTGADLALGNGEVLADNSVANYLKSGSNYFGYTSTALTSPGDVTGFMLSANAVIGTHYVDNIGLWATTDGSVDTVDGVSVMQLDFGTRPAGAPRKLGLFILSSVH